MNKKVQDRWNTMIKTCKDEQAAALKADPNAKYDCTKQAWYKSLDAIKAEEKKTADPKKVEEAKKAFDSDKNGGSKCYGSCMRAELGDNVCGSGDPSCCRAYCVNTQCPVTQTKTPQPSGSMPGPTGSGNGGGNNGGTTAGGTTAGGTPTAATASSTAGGTDGGDTGTAGGTTGTAGGTTGTTVGRSSSSRSSVSSRTTSSSSSRSSAVSSFGSSRSSIMTCTPGNFCPNGALCPVNGVCPPVSSSSRSSSRSSARSSSNSSRFSATSSFLQVFACPPDACGANGNAGNNFCAQQGMTCISANAIPCIRCSEGEFGSSSFSDISFGFSSASSRSSAPPSLYVCGNGKTDPGEQCDDGNLSNRDGCSTTCERVSSVASSSSSRTLISLIFCGNRSLDPGEQCDLGAQNSDLPDSSCRTDCTLSRCGDRIVDGVRGEACDDGNGTAGDGCSPSCALEQLAGEPQPGVLPGSLVELPFVPGSQNQGTVVPSLPAHGPVGNTGPETVAIMAAGASAGYTWMKMRRKRP